MTKKNKKRTKEISAFELAKALNLTDRTYRRWKSDPATFESKIANHIVLMNGLEKQRVFASAMRDVEEIKEQLKINFLELLEEYSKKFKDLSFDKVSKEKQLQLGVDFITNMSKTLTGN